MFTSNYSDCRPTIRGLADSVHAQVFDGVDTVSLSSAAMCTSVCPVSLLAVVVVAFLVHPAPVVCQCTTGHCHDDGDGVNDVSVLTAMVSRLQDTVEQLQDQLHDSTERHQQHLRDTREQLQQQLMDTTEQQQKQLMKLSDRLDKQEKCMYSLFSTIADTTIKVKC